ncbi:MAG: VOC family protein [Rhodobacteraceae bacterium]|nr:VOC family protein [Paracoccaceae bacterium]
MTRLEHVNVTVGDPDRTAALLCDLFGWRVRWAGPGMTTGRTVHVGGDDSYLALFSYGDAAISGEDSYRTRAGLNHIAVAVEDLAATEARVKAAGLEAGNHADYEPGRRFYFHLPDGIEIEVVSYG